MTPFFGAPFFAAAREQDGVVKGWDLLQQFDAEAAAAASGSPRCPPGRPA
ncbi:MAG: hypothetical protein LM577_08530 [Thermoproteaceae archaeon]|nr:hypothetical protein [Thermoproteaceae archaeon]